MISAHKRFMGFARFIGASPLFEPFLVVMREDSFDVRVNGVNVNSPSGNIQGHFKTEKTRSYRHAFLEAS